ncbi:MAG: transcription termination/antitermination protein NusG [Thermoguttaceae bacterium]
MEEERVAELEEQAVPENVGEVASSAVDDGVYLKVRTERPVLESKDEELSEEPVAAKGRKKTARVKVVKEKVVKEKKEKPVKEKKEKAEKPEKYHDFPAPAPVEDPNYVPGSGKDWYILKVQVNREDPIRDAILRRAAISGLKEYFGDIVVPTEKVTEFRGGKKRITKKKLYPGYLVISVEITRETWLLVRETPGVSDFTGSLGKPTPMLPHEVQRMLNLERADTEEAPKLNIGYQIGDKIKVKDGTFENFEGEVHAIDLNNGRVTVMLSIFGRSTPVELEYWQVEIPS